MSDLEIFLHDVSRVTPTRGSTLFLSFFRSEQYIKSSRVELTGELNALLVFNNRTYLFQNVNVKLSQLEIVDSTILLWLL